MFYSILHMEKYVCIEGDVMPRQVDIEPKLAKKLQREDLDWLLGPKGRGSLYH